MTPGNNNDHSSLTYWRDVLDNDADDIWQALEVERHLRPMTLRHAAANHPWTARLKLAAVLACFSVMVMWQWQSAQRVQQLHTENLVLRLESHNPVWQLHALQSLAQLPPQHSQRMTPALMRVLASADDPNVQLQALEILVRDGVIRSPADIPALGTTPSQAQFITTSFDRLFHL